MMVFTRRTKFNDEDLYFSKFINGNWTTTMPIDELNSSLMKVHLQYRRMDWVWFLLLAIEWILLEVAIYTLVII